MSFSKSEIALAEAARAISAFWKTHKCKLIPNWTRNRMITYTNCTPLSAITIINLISPELSGTEPASGEDESGEDESGIGSGSGAGMFCLFLTVIWFCAVFPKWILR